MFAGDIVEILESKAACLPGSRDLEGRPLIIIYVPTELQPWTKDNLEHTLQYFSSIFSQDTRRRGFTILVDCQKTPWRVARACIRHVRLSLGPDLASFIVLRPDGFWDKQRVDNCTKIRKEGEPIFIPISRLSKYVDYSQLTNDFGGTWSYNHSQWIQNRLVKAKSSLGELEKFHQKLIEFTTSKRLSTPTDPFVFTKQNFDTNKIIAQKILQTGKELLDQIEKTDRECQRNNSNDCYKTPQDATDTRIKIEKLLEVMEEKQECIDKAWLNMEKKCVDAREITLLETGVARVTKWILGVAETMLNSQQEVGYDVPSSEELRAEHEALELQCRETYGQYAELLHKIDILPQLNINIPEDLKSQRDFMDFVCRSFATRLERRRNILITCLRFYRLVTEYFEKTNEVFETLVVSTEDSAESTLESAYGSLQELQENQININFLAKELLKEGEKLSDLLSMPVKDALGRDVDVNYENDIVNVQEILGATLSRKQLFSDSVDLQKLTLEQVTHVHVYEKDAKQAVQWLNDLFQVMMKEYVHVGCNVNEIQMMKEEHQAFQETAKGTYDYGCQLLNAASALRHSCKLPEDYNVQLTQNLWQAWKRLQMVGQEQMTRLRVSAVFHRTVQEHCKQLKELRNSVQELTKIEDANKKKLKIRKLLHNREKLLMEVGRMVRLGRLLKTRLKEPVFPEQR
ncbi:Hyaluronan mediated motility receptor, putative [Pediculus humanus corporis]|uniref:Hyaluronan mediated motility receptor, putative n=1 Tax=Pediculus humanus subsp. corporis TaxID=121224 RepID=E0W004_PEDHC|nr:Hyaluronan mediated motility receptor, putative [Pediculus humanus corporis]EEB18960.1 Hyaluronan mediated motility receptor, putative [Pediculus humanus corporis]